MRTLDKNFKKNRYLDGLFKAVALSCALLTLLVFFCIFLCLMIGSLPSIQAFGLGFLNSAHWNPVMQSFGALVPFSGTLMTSVIALSIGVPISFGVAFFITEICPAWLSAVLGTLIELLAAIPSIIYGMWGLFVFAPFFARYGQPWLVHHLGKVPGISPLFQGLPLGIGILSAGIILSVMIIPFIASVMRDVFNYVPVLLKESAFALGATRWEVMRSVTLPHARSGVIGGIILGLGRALGETMAVAFVIGNSHQASWSIIESGSSITSLLANEFNEAEGTLYSSALIELALLLFIFTFIILFISKWLLWRLNTQEQRLS